MNLQKAKEKVFGKPTANRKTQIPSSYFLSASDMIELSEIAQTCDNGIFEVIALAQLLHSTNEAYFDGLAMSLSFSSSVYVSLIVSC